MTSPELSIPVRDLDAAGRPYRFPLRLAWLRGALEETDIAPSGPDGELDVRVSRSGNDVVIRGTVKAELTLTCSRCLGPAQVAVKEAISALAVPASAARESPGAKDDDDLCPDQADLIPYDGDTLVLDDLVRDELVLAVPMIPLCSQDCAGIRPEHSEPAAPTDGHVDPRLRPLLRLKKNLT
jgi:uncharacterized protein